MKGWSSASKPDSLVCPLCEAGSLSLLAHDSAGCSSCGGSLSGAMLGALREIAALPDSLALVHVSRRTSGPAHRELERARLLEEKG